MPSAKHGAQFLVIDGSRVTELGRLPEIKDIYNVAEWQHIAIFDQKVFIVLATTFFPAKLAAPAEGSFDQNMPKI